MTPAHPIFDFDTVIPRRNTGSFKWDLPDMQGVLPMWVADMDFASPPCILDALKRRIDHGIFGYAMPEPSLVQCVLERLQRQYQWTVRPEWLVWLPGLETALTLCAQAVGKQGDGVVCIDPIYPPFYTGPKKADRKAIRVPLLQQDGQWHLDWELLEKALAEPATSLLLFCHPHNPTGKVFSKDELLKVAELCLKHGVVICSDEVHCDLILNHRPHFPMGCLSPDIAMNTISFMAPNKTFNIAGLASGFAIIPNDRLRQSFKLSMRSITPQPSPLAYTACESAYRDGEPWRLQLLEVLRSNVAMIEAFVTNRAEHLSMIAPESTYLAWIQCHGLGVKDPTSFFKGHRVAFSPGAMFGDGQSVRLNFGCPKATLQEGLNRMGQAIESKSK